MDKTDKKVHINFWYVIAAVLGMLLIQDLYLESTKLTPIPYSQFQTLLDENKIAKIAIAPELHQRVVEGGAARRAQGIRHGARRSRPRPDPQQARGHL